MGAKKRIYFDMVDYLKEKRRTFKSVQRKFKVKERTLYRYFKDIEKSGIMLEQDFNKKWFVIEGKCPLCGREESHG